MQKHTPAYHFWGPPRAAPDVADNMAGIRSAIGLTESDINEETLLRQEEEIRVHRGRGPDVNMAGDYDGFDGEQMHASRPRGRAWAIQLVMIEAIGDGGDVVEMYQMFDDTLSAGLDANLSVTELLSIFWFLTGLIKNKEATSLLSTIHPEPLAHETRAHPVLRLLALAAMIPFGANVAQSLDFFQRIFHMEEVQQLLANLLVRDKSSLAVLDVIAVSVSWQVTSYRGIGPPLFDCKKKAMAKLQWLLTAWESRFMGRYIKGL